jgi:hypothetical protein
MQINRFKTAALIAIVLIMTSVMFMALPVSAQDENQPHGGEAEGFVGPTTVPSDAPSDTLYVDTNPYLSVSPNPTGVGQYVLVNFWITPPPSNQRFLSRFTVEVTKPDESKDTIGPLNSYLADGTSWSQYVVDQVGTWEFKFVFPGEYFPAGRYISGDLDETATSGGVVYPAMYYRPATSIVTELKVLNEQVLSWPPSPLPTDYWTRPISPENREWYSIAGVYPWPYTNWNIDDYGPWLTVPNSAHIVWYDNQQNGGIIGGDTYTRSLTTAPATTYVTYLGRGYETKFVPINGVPTSCAVCYDLRTGEVIYAIPISEGGVTPFIVAYYPPGVSSLGAATSASYELLGGSILDQRARQVDSRLLKVNPNTGAVTNLTGMSGLFYNGQFVLSVQDLGASAAPDRYRLINWTVAGNSNTFASRVLNNISFPLSAVGGWNDFDAGITVQATSFTEGLIYGGNLTAVSTITGEVLWTKDLGTETMFNSNRVGSVNNGKLAICMENRYFNCWDMRTGHLLWKSELTEYPWGDFWSYDSSSWNNMLFAGSYEGVYAFSWDDGKIVWNYKALENYVPYETPYDEYSWHSSSFIADGCLIISNDEHTVTQPVTRGWKYYCLNATTGEKIWSIQAFNSDARFCAVGIGDGYLTLPDQYTGIQWSIGKGKSATTVSAPDVSVPLGTAFTIKGSVLDMSPAQPNTPCVSKDSMTTQMEYLHMGMPIGGIWGNETISGVPVSLIAIDEAGVVTDLGSVTTNGYYGTFEKAWTPSAEGTYQIVANFASDDSYGSSAAATAVTVGPAPEPITIPEQPTPADYTWTIIGAAIAVIIAVALVGAVILMKKK